MSGSETPEDPYIIMTVKQLQAMKDNLTASYAFGNDIYYIPSKGSCNNM
jgi:hypothetical protein